MPLTERERARTKPAKPADDDDDLFENEQGDYETETQVSRSAKGRTAPSKVIENEMDDDFDESDEPNSGNDLFDNGSAGFVNQKDLENRLLLIYPLSIGTRESNIPGSGNKEYNYVVTNTHVLSGKPTDLLEVPSLQEGIQLSGVNLVGKLSGRIIPTSVNHGRPILGVLKKHPANRPGMSPSWVLEEADDRQKNVARKYMAELKRKMRDNFDA